MRESQPTDADKSPRARVEAYIREWHEMWQLQFGGREWSASMFGAASYDMLTRWSESIRAVKLRHWVTENVPGPESAAETVSSEPAHDPNIERVTRCEVQNDGATVETDRGEGAHGPRFHEYNLVSKDGFWRIHSAWDYYEDEGARAFDDEAVADLLRKVSDRAMLPCLEDGVSPECDALFQDGRVAQGTWMRAAEPQRVRRIGKIALPSGAIVARDFGYSPEDALPLSLRVKAGQYEVELCELDTTIAAVRIVFDPESQGPHFYRQAVHLGDQSSGIGVDAGNVALCDAAAFIRRTKRKHDRDYHGWVETVQRAEPERGFTFIKLDENGDMPDCVVVRSGHGDGGYPAYWVLDGRGTAVALVVDFLVAAQFLEERVVLSWSGMSNGMLSHPTLTARNVEIEVDRGDGKVTAVGKRVNRLVWKGAAGEIVLSTQGLGGGSCGDASDWHVPFEEVDQRASVVEVVLDAGYRN